MFFRHVLFVVSLSVEFLRGLDGSSSCDRVCLYEPVFTPPTLVVNYGDPVFAICTVCEDLCIDSGLEVSLGNVTKNGTKLLWEVGHMDEWDLSPKCYFLDPTDDNEHCCTRLTITVYQPPDSVTISYVNHSGPVLEGDQYTLQCNVQAVAPVGNLAVTFYRGQAALGPPQSRNNTQKTPATENFTLTINPSAEDDGVQYWCEAKLELGPEGPQPPPVVRSQNLTATVHYKPQTPYPDPISFSITEGDTLRLNCTAMGNPGPSYNWTGPTESPALINDSVLTINSIAFSHEGQYSCVASNNLGEIQRMFNVDVKVDLLPIFAGLAAAAVVTMMVASCFVYHLHYRNTRMGHYKLKNVLHFRRSNHESVPTGGD